MPLLCCSKSYLEPFFRTIKLNVEIKYTNVTCSTSYFEKISLQLGCQWNWSESCFGSIFKLFVCLEGPTERTYTKIFICRVKFLHLTQVWEAAFGEQINDFHNLVRKVFWFFIQHRYAAVWAPNYQLFDLAPVITLLSNISNVIMEFMKLAQVIIGDHFLQK